MAYTQIADVVVPAVYDKYVAEKIVELNKFIQSGVLFRDPALDQKLLGGGKIFSHPFWKSIATDDMNISTDDATAVTAEKITAAQLDAVRQVGNKAYSSTNLARILAGDDPLAGITTEVAKAWVSVMNRRLIASYEGIIADNIANDSGDMVYDASVSVSGSVDLDVNGFTASNYLGATLTMGENMEEVEAIAVHSVVYNQMQNQNLIDFVEASDAKTQIAFYQGARVIVDDKMPVEVGTGAADGCTFYTCFLYGAEAASFGFLDDGSKVDTNEAAGNGAGIETLYDRKQFALVPGGFSWLAASVAAASGTPTEAELRTAANWNRVASSRKHVPFAALIVNG